VAVGLAAVEQARDGLLADVAAFREADGALVEPGLLRDRRVVEVDSVARAPALDPHDLRRDLGHRHGAGLLERGTDRGGVLGVAQHVDARVGRDQADGPAGDLGGAVGVLVAGKVIGARDRPRARADQRQQAGLDRALVQLDVVADLKAPDHVEQRLQRRALGVEQQLGDGVAHGQHAQVAEHLALVRQKRRVAPAAVAEADDVVGHLAGEKRLRIAAGQREPATLGAVVQAAVVRQRTVLCDELVGDRGHGPRIALGAARARRTSSLLLAPRRPGGD